MSGRGRGKSRSRGGAKSRQRRVSQDRPQRGSKERAPPPRPPPPPRPAPSKAIRNILQGALATAIGSAAARATSGLGADDGDASSQGRAGDFSLFLFAQSWAPRFCCLAPAPCLSEGLMDVQDVATHGLWPAYTEADPNNRTYPQFCLTSPSHPEDASWTGRERHEWLKHGTCSGLAPEAYFGREEELEEHVAHEAARDLLSHHAEGGTPVALEALWAAYGGERRVAVKADRECRLEELTTCWSRDLQPTDCPLHVLASARNSALLSQCTHLALEEPGACKRGKLAPPHPTPAFPD